MRIDYGKYRTKFLWQIHETEQCIFHVYSIYEGNTDIAEIISGTKKRLSAIANILYIDLDSIEAKEKRAKYNNDLLQAASEAEIQTFGWPMGVVMNTDEYRPKPRTDGIFAEVITGI